MNCKFREKLIANDIETYLIVEIKKYLTLLLGKTLRICQNLDLIRLSGLINHENGYSTHDIERL